MIKPRPTAPVKATSVNAARGARRKILRKTWDIWSIRWTTMKSTVIILAQGDLCGTAQTRDEKTQWDRCKRQDDFWTLGCLHGQDASVTTMIEYRSHAMRKRHSVNFRQTEETAVLTHQLWQKRRAVRTCRPHHETNQTNRKRNVRKHAEARVTVPSHLTHVHMSEHKQWVQVVDMSLVICDSVVHRSKSGSDEFDSSRHTPNPGTESSQVKRQENAQSSDSWKNGMISRNLQTLLPHGELCGTNSKNRISKHEVHEPSAHDEDLPFLTKEFGNYRRIPNILSGSIEDKCVDMGMFIFSSIKAAIHLGPNYLVNLEIYKKKNFEIIQSLFNITQK